MKTKKKYDVSLMSSLRLMYADQLSDKFKELRNVDGSQVTKKDYYIKK